MKTDTYLIHSHNAAFQLCLTIDSHNGGCQTLTLAEFKYESSIQKKIAFIIHASVFYESVFLIGHWLSFHGQKAIRIELRIGIQRLWFPWQFSLDEDKALRYIKIFNLNFVYISDAWVTFSFLTFTKIYQESFNLCSLISFTHCKDNILHCKENIYHNIGFVPAPP